MERPNGKGRPVERLTVQQFRDLQSGQTKQKGGTHRKNKYGSRRIETDDGSFDSAGEHTRYCTLMLLQRTGQIKDLKRQVRFALIVNGEHISIENKIGVRRRLYYEADFTYIEDDKLVIEDFKGFDTSVSRLKRAIVEAMHSTRVRITRR